MVMFVTSKLPLSGATLFDQLKIGQLSLANYFMQIRLDLEGLKIQQVNLFLCILIPGVTISAIHGGKV